MAANVAASGKQHGRMRKSSSEPDFLEVERRISANHIYKRVSENSQIT